MYIVAFLRYSALINDMTLNRVQRSFKVVENGARSIDYIRLPILGREDFLRPSHHIGLVSHCNVNIG